MVKKAKKQATEEVKKEVEVIPSLVKEPTPAPAKPVSAPAKSEPEAKPFELGRKTPLGIGMPKSGKPWKVLSERSSKHKEYNPRSWEKKMAEKRKLKAVRDRVKEERDKRKEARKAIAQRLAERLKRKEVNTMKSASYQIVSNIER